MPVVRGSDRIIDERTPDLPSLQLLVDDDAGSEAATILVNRFAGEQAVPEHVHEVEEILLVMDGQCVVMVDDSPVDADAGDAVIVPPHTRHAIHHHGPEHAMVVAVLASPTAFK